MMSTHVLDDSQRAAVQVAPGHRQLVIAPPGSGKTEVVSHLVAHLLESGVDPVDGVLVLSFSNAAVYAADARLRERGAGPVTVQTMDSLAGEILRDLSDADEFPSSFDERIQQAAQLLADHHWDHFDRLEHLVVDEIQDVVGVRADFLLAILRSLPDECGFSLLGDPAQGIYDWQLRPDNRPASRTTSMELLALVQRMEHVQVRELSGRYRAVSRDARKVLELRDDALRGDPDGRLEKFLADVVPAGAIEDAVTHAVRWQGTTALLTANNGQALLTAGAIASTGQPVELRRSAHQRVLAGWIARLLADHPTSGITRDEFDARAAQLLPGTGAAALWRALRSVTGGRGREVDIAQLAQGLRRHRPLVPDLVEPVHATIVVSTVHRAKGLEFDNVVRLDFPDKPWLDEPDRDEDEERRLLFVAFSRARHVIARADGPDDRRLRSLQWDGNRRWYLTGPKSWMTFGFELRIDDLDRDDPPGRDPVLTQEHIRRNVRAGDPLTLELDLTRSTLELPVWEVLHDGVVVGRTSTDFGRALVLGRRLGARTGRTSSWPILRGARVEGVATTAGDPRSGPVGQHGLWSSVVCPAMLQVDWSGERDA